MASEYDGGSAVSWGDEMYRLPADGGVSSAESVGDGAEGDNKSPCSMSSSLFRLILSVR